MNSDLPPEAHHYRRSQTPESPRPLHLPEPSNIPVLQNQMDPVFNDTTTYDIALDTSASKPSDLNQEDHVVQEIPLDMIHAPAQLDGYAEGQDHANVQNSASSSIALNGNTESQANSTNSYAHTSNATAPDLQRTLDSLAQFTENANANPEQEQLVSSGEASHEDYVLPNPEVSASGPHAQPDRVVRPDSPDGISKEGVNYQSLLDTLSQSTATAPAADILTAPTTASATEETIIPQTGSEKSLPVVPGLPPRPPPQEKPAIHPNYSPSESIRSYHHLPPQNASSTSYQAQTTSFRPAVGLGTGSNIPPPQSNARAANGLPPPPVATFQQSPASNAPIQSPSVQSLKDLGGKGTKSPSQRHESESAIDEEQPWGQEIQKKYDEFLHDERIYVTEGVWDRFPPGSRLFVGNLPTEKVTKRDLFHIFHKHGKLAQISLKQAYGFVQFLEASACYDALSKEQGASIRGRKIHLEISKPQKGSRNSGPADGKQPTRRRSRSPDRRRSGAERGSQFERLPFSDFRDEPARRRDDYRPMRSPSPRGFKTRDEYRVRDRSPVAFNHYGRPRSPPYGRDGGRYRSPSPRGFDDEAALPLPRRDPRDVPDVQILILEDVDQHFSRFIENGFKHKGLRAATIHLNPRITLGAVVKRQIIEGVQAVVKLTRHTQYNHRIPLQVFDRGTGATSVNFNEYVDLDVSTAADIVIQARQKERMALPASATPVPAQPYGHSQPQPSPYPYPQPPSQPYAQSYQQPYQPPHPPAISSYSAPREPSYGGPGPLSPNGGGQNLQELLANLRQTPRNQAPTQHMSAAGGGTPDLGALLSNVARQQNQNQGYLAQPYHHQPSNSQFAQRPPMQPYTNPAAMPSYTGNQGMGTASQQGPAQNVQNIMDQLARWKQ
ncbi:hypothetical protein GJ744_012331 [Endocarpon pusillum]|uniref:RRM domain-containing protein n=1 Tax=Endocarpon pusillum TaxID=364733 RepID=A0A8H7AEJ0_9EURO|nr:hypothetical protein GJ744_012331 [Endocarpon pusillum]